MNFVTVAFLALCSLYVYLVQVNNTSTTSARREHVLENIEHPGNGGNNQTQAVGHDDNDLVSVARRVSKHSGTVLVTMINDAYLSFTYSWLCNTKDMGIHKSVLIVIITNDESSKRNLTRDWPEVSVVSMDMNGSIKGNQVYSHAGYVKIMVKRTEMLLAILMADIEVFLFEVDCLWFTDPTPKLKAEKGFDILVNPVATSNNKYAGGFLYLFPTEKAKGLWRRLTEMMVDLGRKLDKMAESKYISVADNDQEYLSRLINERWVKSLLFRQLLYTCKPKFILLILIMTKV